MRIYQIVFLLALAFPMLAHGQVSYEGCVFMGRPVPSIPMAIGDIAMAQMNPRWGPVIIYDPRIISMASQQTRVFFYFHECAHHLLGHTLGGLRLDMEQQADCWAIRQLVYGNLFGAQDVGILQAEIAAFGRGDWTHLPGPMRAINLTACL